ncbi:hypothetical protein ACFLTI_05890 [Bacteroidota bacterium]
MKKTFGIILLVIVGLNLITIFVRASNGNEIGSGGYILILGFMLIGGIALVSSNKKKNTYPEKPQSELDSFNDYTKTNNQVIKTIKEKYPNFYEYCLRLPKEVKIRLHKNNSTILEFRMPIVTFGRVMGYNYVGIELNEGEYCIYMNSESVSGKKIKGTWIYLENDQSSDKYEANIQELSSYLMTETDYMKITVGEI